MPKRSSVPQNQLCATKQSKLSKNSAQAEFLSFGTRRLHKLRVFRCQNEALCHNSKLCAKKNRHNYPKNSAQAEFLSFGTRRLHKLRVFRCQNEALCHKPKLCAINQSKLSKNSAQAEFLCFCTRLLVKHEFPDAKAKLCAINRPLTHKYNTLLVLFPDKLVLFPDKLRYNY